jgi:Spy/CpxP family protein refolding chaperone
MKKQFTLLSLTLAAACAVPLSILAEDAVPPKAPGGDSAPAATPAPGGRQGGGARLSPEERLKKMTEELGLTQDQQDKIKAIMEKNAPQIKDLMAKGRQNLTDEDKTKFRDLLKAQTEDIAAVLTPEQKEKFKASMERRRGAGGPGGAAAATPAAPK